MCLNLGSLSRGLYILYIFLGGQDFPPTKDILTYNPDTEAWTKTSEMMVGRYGHGLTEVVWDDYSRFCKN